MMQTRSAATKLDSGQKVDASNTAPLQPNNSELRFNETEPPAKERRHDNVGTLTKKPRRGKNHILCQLNLDVFYLIFECSCPLDILNFARTCKSFRELLMSKSSAFIWRAARRQIEGLPDCPADLSEPAYANLVFYPRCHGCGKHTPTIFWRIRRRYCPDCRVQRLCDIPSLTPAIWDTVRPICEEVMLTKRHRTVIDKDQIDLFMKEYEQSCNKVQFLQEKWKHYDAIHYHARLCAAWQKRVAADRKDELKVRRQERVDSIFERLKQLGYGPEINHFGRVAFQKSLKKISKPLTDEEWTQMLPEWLERMSHYRQLRLTMVVYKPRRKLLMTEYDRYVAHQPPDTPSFDLLPHIIDLACFPPFRDVIEAPEDHQLGDDPFAYAFSQLSNSVGEWRKQLEANVAKLVKIPSHLSLRDTSGDQAISNGTNSTEACSEKLQLASALFYAGHHGVFAYPQVLLMPMRHRHYLLEEVSKPIEFDQFGIHFLDEAPYIVHACGLDPFSATADDMDQRNARLICLCCKTRTTLIMGWREAVLHTFQRHRNRMTMPLSESPHWQLLSEEYMDMVLAAESPEERSLSLYSFGQCLLCQPRVGDGIEFVGFGTHLCCRHDKNSVDVVQGMDFAYLCISRNPGIILEMVEEEGQVSFRKV